LEECSVAEEEIDPSYLVLYAHHRLAAFEGHDVFKKKCSSIICAPQRAPCMGIVTDVSMIATHGLGYDYDVLMDRNARWLLGGTDSKIRR
jgi:hypothetical protein